MSSLTAICLANQAIGGDKATIEAPAGHFRAYVLGARSDHVEFAATLRLSGFHEDSKWPPAAYLGFQEGPDRSRSIQVVLIRNHGDTDRLALGYRLILGGKEAKLVFVDYVGIDHVLNVRLIFHQGVATLYLDNAASISIQTPFTSVEPYVSVSSAVCEVEFISTPKQ